MGLAVTIAPSQRREPCEPADGYDLAAPYYDEWKWQRIWRAAEWGLVQDALRLTSDPSSVLDVGCGTGTLLGAISGIVGIPAELIGVDVSRGMLERAKRKYSSNLIEFVHHDFLQCRLPENSFDLIFMCRVASHIADLEECLGKTSALLRDGGKLAFSDVYSEHPYECTKLPHPLGKIPVKTWKHKFSDILDVAGRVSLVPVETRMCFASNLPGEILVDPTLPKSLINGYGSAPSIPFGCLAIFSRGDRCWTG
jgi:ubiquinone/menaquinone biosynthesis C-methylase UbiE